MPYAADIRLVVFDMAGTTVDFGSCAPAGAFVRAFAAAGVAVTEAAARRPMGLHKKDHIRAMLGEPPLAADWHAATGRAWAEADVEELYRLVTPMQVAAAAAASELTPGVTESVVDLRRRGIKIAATTGYFRAAAEVVYAAAREQGFAPDFTISADGVPAGRPAPWMIFRAMEALGVYPVAAVVKVGDTVIDIEDGKNAGVWSVGVVDSSNEMGLPRAAFDALPADEKESRRQTVRDRFVAAGADATIDSLHEVSQLIDALNELRS